ncbi:uncharacterized protein LOC115395896 [Salarias fasciatus]|uniref:uncharacterized protein LOC115395896 n=1 Tax=Salarias fasciatus TaxID=181472 RepID=UPI0011770D2C|nr:uncharacterized protein LOC115395896 [Salarias fasciatus]
MALKSQLTLTLSQHQERHFISRNVGEDVILNCSYDAGGESAWLFWYKQPLDQQLRLISSFYVFDTEESFHNEFKNNQRFTQEKANNFYHLVISEVQISDSATYYCASSNAYDVKFTDGVTLIVREPGLSVQAWIDQSVSGAVQLGGSATLRCDVQVEICDGEHSVYWFKNSADHHRRILYEGRARECEKKVNTKTLDCVYHLDLKGLNQSHAGNYYCALVACGNILFGNGTMLGFDDGVNSQVVVDVLIGALAFSTILSVALSGLVYKVNQKNSFQSTDVEFSAPTLIEGESQETDNLHYAALSLNTSKRLRTQSNPAEDGCVYASVMK